MGFGVWGVEFGIWSVGLKVECGKLGVKDQGINA